MHGLVGVQLISADVSDSLDRIIKENIMVLGVQYKNEMTVSFTVNRRDLNYLIKLMSDRGNRVDVISRNGIFWTVSCLLHRPVLLLGLVVFVILTLYLPTKVLFFSVERNSTVPAKLIIEAAHEVGLRFGISRSDVKSEAVKNALLTEIPDLKWAGINMNGCNAVISVTEKHPTEPVKKLFVSNIVAAKDGIIIRAEASNGTLVCREGQAVEEGQLLISGYTDCGLKILAGRSEGEIYAQTQRTLEAVVPSYALGVKRTKDIHRVVSLIIGKNRINLYKGSGICHGSCGRMYKEYCIMLPGGFSLPVAIGVDSCLHYDLQPSLPERQRLLADCADAYLQQEMIGGTIYQCSYDLQNNGELVYLKAHYICKEMIGRELEEQIGDFYG